MEVFPLSGCLLVARWVVSSFEGITDKIIRNSWSRTGFKFIDNDRVEEELIQTILQECNDSIGIVIISNIIVASDVTTGTCYVAGIIIVALQSSI